MKNLILLIPFIFTVGCSTKSQSPIDQKIQYQRFLNQKSEKILNKELNNYEK